MTIRRIRADEGLRWREVRLRALRTDPQAFGATYAAAAKRSDSEWTAAAQTNSSSNDLATFFAVTSDDQIVGLAVANRDQPQVFSIYQMWVAPESRRAGVAMELLSAIEVWALAHGGTTLQLSVSDLAPAARRLYERAGFGADGRSDPSGHPGALKRWMTKRL